MDISIEMQKYGKLQPHVSICAHAQEFKQRGLPDLCRYL